MGGKTTSTMDTNDFLYKFLIYSMITDDNDKNDSKIFDTAKLSNNKQTFLLLFC